jgi:hypothetical protein
MLDDFSAWLRRSRNKAMPIGHEGSSDESAGEGPLQKTEEAA